MSDSLRTVVLIEDDPGVQLAAAQALQIGGFEVLPCDSAEQAQALLKPDFPAWWSATCACPARTA
jgi:two-component system C4-dicarboxylate transport response regulator DctD